MVLEDVKKGFLYRISIKKEMTASQNHYFVIPDEITNS